MGERTIKGSILKSRLAYVEQRLGAAGVARVVSRLRQSDREILQGILLPSAWYPFETQERLDKAIADELGERDDIYKELGQKSAEHNLSASQKVYVHAKDPHGLLKSAASIYRLYYSTGERTYERVSDKKAILRTIGSETYSRQDCLTIVGWHEKAIGMCGGKNPKVRETKCRVRGDELCEYVCEWE
jgi:uncharacterized protein (TIGR02265 family)